MVSPQKVATSGLWEVISLPPVSRGRPEFEPRFLQSDEWCSPPLTGSCTSLGSIVHPRPSSQITRRMNPPLDQAVHWRLVGSPPGGPGRCTPVTREVITHHLHNPRQRAPKKCCGKLLAVIWGTEAI
jgi:hypothetical protein